MIRPEVERLLAKAKIRIDEDQVEAPGPSRAASPQQPRQAEPEAGLISTDLRP